MGRVFSRGIFFRENLTLGEFAKIPIRNSSCMLRSTYRLNFTRGDWSGLNCLEHKSVGRRDLSVGI